MGFAESSSSEGEIVEASSKANTTSSRHREPGIDNPSRGKGRNGVSGLNGESHKVRCYGQRLTTAGYHARERTRSPSPYRRKPDRSPSPYRRGRSRSPSPYRRDRTANGRENKPPAHPSNKRKASPPRHPRPEKKYFSDRSATHSRRDPVSSGHGQAGGPPHRHGDIPTGLRLGARISYADNEEVPPIPSFHEKKIGPNGSGANGQAQPSRTTVLQPSATADIPHRGKDAAADEDTPMKSVEEQDEIPLVVVEDKPPSEETREEKRRRWALKRQQLAAATAENPGTNLLQQALLHNTSESATPDVGSPAALVERSVSPALSSPRLPAVESVPASPGVMVIDKDEEMGQVASPAVDGPSAANYDPTQDMLDDRVRAQQKAQQSGVSATAYDETNPTQLATVPAETAKPAKKKKKKEIDMFAFSDEEEDDDADDDADEEEGQPTLAKGTVLDASLLDNWDDAEGYYRIISNELVYAERYRMIRGLGRGVFANVAEAEDVTNPGQLVAIKMVRRNEAMKKASLKEMEFLRRLNDADPQDKRHIIRFLGSFDHKGHLCIVFEHMLKNLRDLLKEDTSGHGLSLQAVRTYSRQMFAGLKHLQDCQIVHADLKPDNILVSHDRKTIKLCDLGTAGDKRDNMEPTPYLVSRFYRAPEIILGMEIGYPIDMWAIGCTIYELWTGKILFPGRSNNQMIRVIMESMGWPTEKLLKKGSLSGDHFEQGPPLKFISMEVDQYTSRVRFRIPFSPFSPSSPPTLVPINFSQMNTFTNILPAAHCPQNRTTAHHAPPPQSQSPRSRPGHRRQRAQSAGTQRPRRPARGVPELEL